MKEKGICLFIGLILTQSAQPEALLTIPSESVAVGDKSITMQNGLLTVKLRGTPLSQVLKRIARQAGFTVIVKGAIEQPVTDEFSFLVLEKGIRRLLQGKNFIFVYAPEKRADDAHPRLKEVRIFSRGAGAGEYYSATAPQAFCASGTQGSEATRKRHSIPCSVGEALQSEDPKVRLKAVESLRKIGGKEAVEVLIAALSDIDPVVRRHVTAAFLEVGDKQAIEPLSSVLLTDEDQQVRRRAVEALLEIADERAIEPLAAALEQDDPAFRAEIVDSLGEAGSEKALELVAFALTDTDQGVRMNAVDALGAIGGKKAIELLLRAKKDGDGVVRNRAAAALSDLQEEG